MSPIGSSTMLGRRVKRAPAPITYLEIGPDLRCDHSFKGVPGKGCRAKGVPGEGGAGLGVDQGGT
jgi:hypothetical protein